jgi:hypothetical protein
MIIDVVIKSFSRDYTRLSYLLNSIRVYFTGYRNVYLFLDDEPDAVDFINNVVRQALDCIVNVVPCGNDQGYMLQQYFKLNGGEFSDADYLLPLDSDMVFFRRSTPADWLHAGKAFVLYGAWQSPQHFPPPKLISEVIGLIGRRTHDLCAYIEAIRTAAGRLRVNILEDLDGKIVFSYEGQCYDLDSARLHSTWLSSIKPITKDPIDTMRIHYMLSKEGLNHVKQKITEYTSQDLRSSILNARLFPIFSEYQVYGNIVRDCQFSDLGHCFIAESDKRYTILADQLPTIKCNTRAESAYQAYHEIIAGRYAKQTNRLAVVSDLRQSRTQFPGEEWH